MRDLKTRKIARHPFREMVWQKEGHTDVQSKQDHGWNKHQNESIGIGSGRCTSHFKQKLYLERKYT